MSDLRDIAITVRDGRPITLADVAKVVQGPQVMRGDCSVFVRDENGTLEGGPSK